MYTLKDIVQLETALLQRIIERNNQIVSLLSGANDLHGQIAERDRRIAELAAQLKFLTGESIKEDEHGADTSPR